jgi:hypothetical protein
MQNINFLEKMRNGMWNTAQGKIHLSLYTQHDSLMDEHDWKQEMTGNFESIKFMILFKNKPDNEPSDSTPSQNSWPAQPSLASSQRFCAWYQASAAR